MWCCRTSLYQILCRQNFGSFCCNSHQDQFASFVLICDTSRKKIVHDKVLWYSLGCTIIRLNSWGWITSHIWNEPVFQGISINKSTLFCLYMLFLHTGDNDGIISWTIYWPWGLYLLVYNFFMLFFVNTTSLTLMNMAPTLASVTNEMTLHIRPGIRLHIGLLCNWASVQVICLVLTYCLSIKEINAKWILEESECCPGQQSQLRLHHLRTIPLLKTFHKKCHDE